MSAITSLTALDPTPATDLSKVIAAMDPWQRLGIAAGDIAAHLLDADDHVRQLAICVNEQCAGVVVLRSPWLYGPYITLLALFPAYQGRGIGSAALRQVELEAQSLGRNVWVCVSSFNEGARRFYERNAFEHVGTLPGLLRPEFSELLMRKRLD